jgi:ribosome-associated heat shock protein Hsp15
LDRQRLDKWLWHARVVRTRSAAAGLVAAGHVRVNGDRERAPGRAVRVDDVVTVALDQTVRLLKVAGFAERRGSASEAAVLFADLTGRGASKREDRGEN